MLVGSLLACPGCKDREPKRSSPSPRSRLATTRHDTSTVLVDSIAQTLNHLPAEVVTQLLPPTNILDDSKSANGQEVLATLDKTPQVPDGPFNYLRVPGGNANFRSLQVRAGDIIRYFVAYDQEDLEHGFENVTYLELPVRRLDANNPQNALIVEGGLNGPVEIPHRIEVWRFSDKRMNEIRVRLTRYIKHRRPATGWEPSPDDSALTDMTDRLNQWWRNLPDPDTPWNAEPLVQQIPADIRESDAIAELLDSNALENASFQPGESRLLQQAVWLRDIAAWANGEGLTDLEIVEALFDWTVRNLQLDDDDAQNTIHHPWQALMFGHGTAPDRAWVFAELCRQQQLDVVMLNIGATAEETPWLLAALWSEGKLHLFDPRLGLPIASAEGIATLAQLSANPQAILQNLRLEGEPVYPPIAEALESAENIHATASIVAAPLQLSRRAFALQQALQAEDYVVLSAKTSPLAKQLADVPTISNVQLWTAPFESLLDESKMKPESRLHAARQFLVFAQRPQLWKARVLHFQGTKAIPLSQQNDPLAQPDLGHRSATRLYQSRNIRPTEKILNQLEPAKQIIYRAAKQHASYWLGLLSYDQQKHEIAADWFKQRTLAATPNGPWTASARYNLARNYEALGNLEQAIELLEADNSPQRHGNLLRAQQLKKKLQSGNE